MNLIEIIKDSWGWIGIDPVEVIGENDFGNLIIKDSLGCYWRLIPEDLNCEIIARSREELDQLSRDQEFLHDWYMKNLVDSATNTYGPLQTGRKFYLVIPGPLSGEYSINNIKAAPLNEIIIRAGDIAKQIQDLPEGAQIELKIIG